jgi:hypothetical protein
MIRKMRILISWLPVLVSQVGRRLAAGAMAALRGGAAVERAANPLYRTRTDAKLLGNDPHTGPVLGPEGFLDSFFQLWAMRGRPSCLPSALARASPARTRS